MNGDGKKISTYTVVAAFTKCGVPKMYAYLKPRNAT